MNISTRTYFLLFFVLCFMFYVLCFMFYVFLLFFFRVCLSNRGLDVVTLEVRLEVEDIHLLGLRYTEQLAKSGIRVDVLLVVEALGLYVVHDATGYIRAGHQRALGLAEEYAKVVRDLRGLREDGGLLGELLAVSIKLGYPRAAAAAGTLELTA